MIRLSQSLQVRVHAVSGSNCRLQPFLHHGFHRSTTTSIPVICTHRQVPLAWWCYTTSRLQLSTSVISTRESSRDASLADNAEDGVSDGTKKNKQPFVQASIKPGEWDPAGKNPLYRPIYRSSATIVSAEDFANQPTVSFTATYDSFKDAMVTLSWLDQSSYEQIYQLYCEIMQESYDKFSRTSHEYVVRVVAQKFHLTPERVAAIIQLKHNEEQIVAAGGRLCTEAANFMDNAIKKEIAEAYNADKSTAPESYVEDPVGVLGKQENKSWRVVEDVFDVETMMKEVTIRDANRAQMIIDDHVYIEDVDDSTILVPLDDDCKKLLRRKEKLAVKLAEDIASIQSKQKLPKKKKENKVDVNNFTIPYKETTGDGKKRPRWKYIAQTVNIRELKKQHSKHRSYRNDSLQNTIVELEGTLRPATLEEIKYTSWKPIRHVQEHTYQTAKKGWLDRTVRNKSNAWGKQKRKEEAKREQPVSFVESSVQLDAAESIHDVEVEEVTVTNDDVVESVSTVEEVDSTLDGHEEEINEATPPTQDFVESVSTNEEMDSSVDGHEEEVKEATPPTQDFVEPISTNEEVDSAVEDHEEEIKAATSPTQDFVESVSTNEEVDSAVKDHEEEIKAATSPTQDFAESVSTNEEVDSAVIDHEEEIKAATPPIQDFVDLVSTNEDVKSTVDDHEEEIKAAKTPTQDFDDSVSTNEEVDSALDDNDKEITATSPTQDGAQDNDKDPIKE